MDNSREQIVWTNLSLIISNLYLVGFYCHSTLLWNGVTDKNMQTKGFVLQV